MLLPCVALTVLAHLCAAVLVESCIVEHLPILSLWEGFLTAPNDSAFNRRDKVLLFPVTTFNGGAAF